MKIQAKYLIVLTNVQRKYISAYTSFCFFLVIFNLVILLPSKLIESKLRTKSVLVLASNWFSLPNEKSANIEASTYIQSVYFLSVCRC